PEIPFARPITGYTPPALTVSEFFLPRQTPRSAWADIGCLALFLLSFEFFALGLLHHAAEFDPGTALSPSEPDASQVRQVMLLPAISLRALGAMVIIAVLARRRGLTARSVGLTWSGAPLNLAIGLATLLVVYGLIAVTMTLLWFLCPAMVGEMEENARRIMELVPNLRPVEFVPLAALIGVYEELVFRGFLMTRLRRATGGWTIAVVLSTVVFTALHAFEQTRSALVIVAILSLVFSLVTIWRRSIIPTIIAHALFDLSQLLWLHLQAGDSWT
ncbi:MAG: type II CAAX endopeptidase family protein, partial [Planctomycetota bacterium]